MYSYPVLDVEGRVIGKMELTSDVIPKAIVNRSKISLGGSYTAFGVFLNFILVSQTIIERT